MEEIILSLDPGSTKCGYSIWQLTSNKVMLLTYGVIEPDSKTTNVITRLHEIQAKLKIILNNFDKPIHRIISEQPPAVAYYGLRLVYGVVITAHPKLKESKMEKTDFISPSTWKALVRKVTKEKDPKGAESLKLFSPKLWDKNIGEDEADSIFIFLAWVKKIHNMEI
jgi:Holliday junction resolvasome RuvABC endonuclease subunit